MKLIMIGEHVINPSNIAYISKWLDKEGKSLGSIIHFNAYAAAANHTDWSFESLYLNISERSPAVIMDLINDEPAF